MRGTPLPSFDPDAREVQFRVRNCTVFRFRPGVAPRPPSPPPGPALFAQGRTPGELIPLTGETRAQAVALRIEGEAMRGLADPGALIYFEDPRTPPTADMLGHVVVVETAGRELLVRRLFRGSGAGLFDLECQAGPPLRDARLAWAAHISAIIPPLQARRIVIVGSGTTPAPSRCADRSGPAGA